eukprot:s2586_g8.t1
MGSELRFTRQGRSYLDPCVPGYRQGSDHGADGVIRRLLLLVPQVVTCSSRCSRRPVVDARRFLGFVAEACLSEDAAGGLLDLVEEFGGLQEVLQRFRAKNDPLPHTSWRAAAPELTRPRRAGPREAIRWTQENLQANGAHHSVSLVSVQKMAISDDGVMPFLEEARQGTQRFPFGRWVYSAHSYEISADGVFTQKLRNGKTARGQLCQDSVTPWAWSVMLSEGGQIAFQLTRHCQLRSMYVRNDQSKAGTADHAGMLGLMNELSAKRAWTASLKGIMEFAINAQLTDEMLAKCVGAVHKIFEWVDEFNERYKSFSRCSNPQFDSFMQEVAESVTTFIRAGDLHDPRRTPRLVVATNFIRCLFQRWPYVTKMTYYLTTTEYHSSLQACRDTYSTMLRASQGKLHACFANMGEENLESLLKQLEALAEREEKDAKELPYARLLEIAAYISTRLHQMLPLTEHQNKFFNLEYLLVTSANQAPDRASFGLEVAPYMGLAATCACDAELAAERLADPWPWAEVTAPFSTKLGACVSESVPVCAKECIHRVSPAADLCCVPSAALACCLLYFPRLPVTTISEEAGASFVEHFLWPLLQSRDFPSPDLQRLVTWAVVMRLERWSCREALVFLHGLWRAALFGGQHISAYGFAQAKEEPFIRQLQSQLALTTALVDACKRTPRFLQQMTVDLAAADWMDREMRCNVSIRLIHSSLGAGGLHLELDEWEALMEQYIGTCRLPDLLQLVLQSLRPPHDE